MENRVIIRFANEDESYVDTDVIKNWKFELISEIGDTYFCKTYDNTNFSIKVEEFNKIPFEREEHYRPLPAELTLDESEYLSEITGKKELGVFAQEDIPAGTRWLTHLKTKDPMHLMYYPDGLIRNPLGGYFNHDSKKPNCKVVHTDYTVHLEATRDINKDEELTAKYTLYDPEK